MPHVWCCFFMLFPCCFHVFPAVLATSDPPQWPPAGARACSIRLCLAVASIGRSAPGKRPARTLLALQGILFGNGLQPVIICYLLGCIAISMGIRWDSCDLMRLNEALLGCMTIWWDSYPSIESRSVGKKCGFLWFLLWGKPNDCRNNYSLGIIT